MPRICLHETNLAFSHAYIHVHVRLYTRVFVSVLPGDKDSHRDMTTDMKVNWGPSSVKSNHFMQEIVL